MNPSDVLYRLADVSWFLKGMIAAGDDTFNESHVRAIQEASGFVRRSHPESNEVPAP